MKQTVDEPKFEYYDDNGRLGWCRLRVWEESGLAPVVIVTECSDNPGTCITDAVETLWPSIWEYLERPVEGMVMLEHYARPDQFELDATVETFDLVTFQGPGQFVNPCWWPLQPGELEAQRGLTNFTGYGE